MRIRSAFNITYSIWTLLCFSSISMAFSQTFHNNQDDFTLPFVVSTDSLIALGKIPTVDFVQKSLTNPTLDAVQLRPVETAAMSARDIFLKTQESTVIVGSAYLCPHCSHTHISNATGYIIAEDGVVVTNYHVVEGFVSMGDGNKPTALVVRMHDGRTFPVREILRASQKDDLAILRLDCDTKLPALALSEGAYVGDDVYVLGHPRGMYYYFTKGMVNSKFEERVGRQSDNMRNVMTISADYAAGASGGPVVDQYGNVVGTVSSTRTFTYNDEASSVQMVVKYTVPVESLRELIN